MSLPSKSIDEILSKASNRHQNQTFPSPRGIDADLFSNTASPAAASKNKVAGSSVECLEYASPSPSSSSSSALARFPTNDKQKANSAITQCATYFLNDVLSKTMTMVGYFNRMTVHTGDVAAALELFVEVDAGGLWYRSFPSGVVEEDRQETAASVIADDADDDEDWIENDENGEGEDNIEDEEMMLEHNSDDESDDESSDDDESSHYHDLKDNTSAPAFDASYPPIIDEIQQLSDARFRELLLLPILEERKLDGVPLEKGVDGMLKRAMYAFLVAKLS